jgi:hypothetical protein
MRYSQSIGILAAFALIGTCFMPWSFIPSKQLTLDAFHTAGTSFGRPGIALVFFTSIAIILFAVKRIWAKRVNIFVVILALAWSIRNFILMSTCFGGECPEKLAGLYLQVFFAALMAIMSLLPKLPVAQKTV